MTPYCAALKGLEANISSGCKKFYYLRPGGVVGRNPQSLGSQPTEIGKAATTSGASVEAYIGFSGLVSKWEPIAGDDREKVSIPVF